ALSGCEGRPPVAATSCAPPGRTVTSEGRSPSGCEGRPLWPRPYGEAVLRPAWSILSRIAGSAEGSWTPARPGRSTPEGDAIERDGLAEPPCQSVVSHDDAAGMVHGDIHIRAVGVSCGEEDVCAGGIARGQDEERALRGARGALDEPGEVHRAKRIAVEGRVLQDAAGVLPVVTGGATPEAGAAGGAPPAKGRGR